jgi:hypothetical protein
MARKIQFAVDTALNYIRVTDYDDVTGGVYFDSNSVLNWGFSYERKANSPALTNALAEIRFHTPSGWTEFFAIADLEYFDVDGAPQVNATLAALITNLAPYIFA